MEIIDNTAAPSGVTLVPQVDHYGASAPQQSYEIAPEDQHHVDALLAIDPINGIEGAHDIPQGWNALGPLKLTALPEPLQAEVEAKLAHVPAEQREAKEAEFTAEAIRAMRPALRLKTGLGPSASPYHREMLAIAREYTDAVEELGRLQDELTAVSHHRTEIDPVTGEAKAIPVYRVSEARRRGIADQMTALTSRMTLLHKADGEPGYEAAKRLQQAMYESVQARKEVSRQVEERAEVKRRAADINREERINEQARRLAALTRNAVV